MMRLAEWFLGKAGYLSSLREKALASVGAFSL
jgi:hypothetical protein